MAMNPEPEKLPLAVKIILLCFIILAGVAVQQSPAPERNIWDVPPATLVVPARHKQELRAQFGEYREGHISANAMLDACSKKLMYTRKGKDALAEYAYALRSQVYLDEGDPETALVEARKAAGFGPSPVRGVVALGDALRAVGRYGEAVGAYCQALLNPNYVPEYTVEDPMDARTLDALFLSDFEAVKHKEYENITVRGKLIALELAELGQPSFILEGCKPNRIVVCSLKQYDIPSKIKNLIDSYVVELAQVCGLSAAMLPGDKLITLMGGETYPFGITFIDDSEIIKISP